MDQKIIKSCFSFLTINKTHLASNFNFKVKKEINNPTITAEITINNQYASKINLVPKVGNSCFVSIQNNNTEKTLIFKGKIINISFSPNKINITAYYNCVDSKIYEETFLKCDTKQIIDSFVSNIKFEATNHTNNRIVFKNTKAENLKKVLSIHNMNYFINKKNQVVVMDHLQRKNAQQYNISNCIKSVESSKISIFPIPELEIGDIVISSDEQYFVTSINYRYNASIKMILGVQACQQ